MNGGLDWQTMSREDRFFVDTNVLIYGYGANSPAAKLEAANSWLTQLWPYRSGCISWQVIFEFYSNSLRKANLSVSVAREIVEQLIEWHPESPSHATIGRAWHWCDRAQVNFWDSLILASAEQAGCRWLLSEDFQAGQRFDSVTIVNPFLSAPAEFGLL
jgi:predicted nucleic acid-binding protein